MVARAAIIFTLALVAGIARADQPRLALAVQPGGVVAASFPASVLSDRDVRRRIDSGLTATFVISARNRAANDLSGARIEIRYDLWDEVWLVRRIEFDRRSERQRIASFEALEAWWRTPVRLLATDAPHVSLQIELTVLPFSAAESDDARQWIAKSGAVGTATGGTTFIDALIGTTISAKPIASYRWNVELALR